MKLSKNDTKKPKKNHKKNNQRAKLIVFYEPDPSFKDDFADFIEDVLKFEETNEG